MKHINIVKIAKAMHNQEVEPLRLPTDEELTLIREVIDPSGLRQKELPDA